MPRKRDPRRLDAPNTANEELLDRAIRHAVYQEGLKGKLVEDTAATLEETTLGPVRGRVAKRLADGTPAYGKRAQTFVDSIAREVQVGVAALWKPSARMLAKIIDAEIEWQTEVLRTATPLTWRFKTVSPALREATLRLRPLQGKLLRDWYKEAGQAAGAIYRRELSEGLRLGESVPNIVKRVRDVAQGTTHRQAEAVVRTAVSHVTNGAKQATFEANQDIVKGWKFVATLDARTTDICASNDGRVFDVGGGPVPPLHIRCRSTQTPVLRSWKELGINLREAPPGTRASMNGQVPATVTYGRWLKAQGRTAEGRAIQDKVLGPTRARLLRSGKVKFERFTDRRGLRLGLEELREREGLTAKDVTPRRAG
jgi:SPP1 gp7 family putative phage head morphogenesis protein